jgi:16S rRNA (adenine1518-N6/adenine1519-N6)-dimethyltransferase
MGPDFSLKKTKSLIYEYGAYPSKGLGQNFLIDRRVLDKILKSTALSDNDVVLEIGPGMGNLTCELAKRAKRIIAVEKDPKMCQILKKTLKGCGKVEIINNDILKVAGNSKLQIQTPKIYKVVGNLPFYLTAPVIRKFLEAKIPPKIMVLIMQKEVAQRMAAQPPRMSLLAVSVQFYARVKIISFVPRKSFWPEPKVDAAVLKIIPKKITTRPGSVNLFFKTVKAGFSQPRKQLVNNLARNLKLDKEKLAGWLVKNKIKPNSRAETLSIKDWVKLAEAINPFIYKSI